jgi:manganese transport protein
LTGTPPEGIGMGDNHPAANTASAEGTVGRAATRSLEGLHGTVTVPHHSASFWRQVRAFFGPAVLVSVGYMDPGNWGTDLQAGATYRYALLWVVALSSFMAIIMQVCSARLGIVTGKDLAQACRDYLPAWTRWPNWISCEIAIGATDLAEVLGSAVAIHLLSGGYVPLFWAVIITAFDVLLLLALQGLGMRLIEAIVLCLVATIGACYFIELFLLPQTAPDFAAMGQALMRPRLGDAEMVLLAIAIIGATVMPHNLYLHSALVQSRQFGKDDASLRRAIRFNTLDSILALSVAFLVNAGILVLAATVFHGQTEVSLPSGHIVEFSDDSDWIQVAYLTLAPLLGTALASTLFAVALLASGQSSTITGTLAGQVVMEGFLRLHVRPWVRRLLTRMVAIVPAVIVIGLYSDQSVTSLLSFSQFILGLQLPLAMFPLLYFTSARSLMGRYANGWLLLSTGWVSCLLITALDVYGLWKTVVTPAP